MRISIPRKPKIRDTVAMRVAVRAPTQPDGSWVGIVNAYGKNPHGEPQAQVMFTCVERNFEQVMITLGTHVVRDYPFHAKSQRDQAMKVLADNAAAHHDGHGFEAYFTIYSEEGPVFLNGIFWGTEATNNIAPEVVDAMLILADRADREVNGPDLLELARSL